MKAIRNRTYRNLMTVIHRLQDKGYDFEASKYMAERIFDDYAAMPEGLSIEQRIDMVLSKEVWEAMYGLTGLV